MSKTPAAILTRYRDAVERRDADAILADFAADAVVFDLSPPLMHAGPAVTDADALRTWFDTWQDDLRVEHREPTVIEQGDLAVLWTLQHMIGTQKNGEKTDLWFRATIAARRIAGEWKIVHLHTSVPFAMDGSGKALLDLKPEA
jgi:ketosteroid isomerase-like protein